MKYRKTLYENYHTTQSGRASLTDAKSLFLREKVRFSKEILPELPKDKSANIFDFGCGSGSMLSVCQDNGYEQSTGMDLSQEQVDMAKDFGVKGVEHGDALVYLKETTDKYDVILGMDIIEHFTKDELVELLIALRRCLTPNGRLIIRTPNLDAPFATVFANGDFTHENYMNVSSAQQVMMACGFQKVSVNASDMSIDNPIKELVRRFAFWELKILYKWQLFATGRSTRDVLFSPNMIIIAQNG